jgi:hypothetical protein
MLDNLSEHRLRHYQICLEVTIVLFLSQRDQENPLYIRLSVYISFRFLYEAFQLL